MSLLEIKGLTIHYITRDSVIRAVNGIDLSIGESRTLGLVGETGAGKTTTALGIMRLVPNPPGRIMSGEILFEGKDILKAKDNELRMIRGNDISMIFQDPMTALNPIIRVGDQIAEVIELHGNCTKAEAMVRSLKMLETVGIQPERSVEYPHQFSGGMKQRVVIAMALACNPKLLIADEPTTALDVTIQAQVLEMMNELKEQYRTSMLLITHDLGIVAETCDEVAIMYAGEIVEYGLLKHIFRNARHPYTIGLFGSIPSLEKDVDRLSPIQGLMPDPASLPTGCKFHERCSSLCDECVDTEPAFAEIEPGHFVRCPRAAKGEI
ncbi:MAG: ABC transporter ATP-binding protein [Peptococcaceae bacterium]|jgi:peptide/nickel transport system ATP-binding protein|nr:ABC transporter ATP-binding protein [Peptococcaceae bacterium]